VFAPQNNRKVAPQIRTGLQGSCIVIQTENSIVTQNRPEESIKTGNKMAYTFIKAKSFMP
jgi:hypothetical protein